MVFLSDFITDRTLSMLIIFGLLKRGISSSIFEERRRVLFEFRSSNIFFQSLCFFFDLISTQVNLNFYIDCLTDFLHRTSTLIGLFVFIEIKFTQLMDHRYFLCFASENIREVLTVILFFLDLLSVVLGLMFSPVSMFRLYFSL